MSDIPLVPIGPVVAMNYSVSPEKRLALFRFMEEAIPFYEKPGGIRVKLYESADVPGTFLELVAYASRKIYEQDQYRIENDPEYRRVLSEWHKFFEGELKISRMLPALPVDLKVPVNDTTFDATPDVETSSVARANPPKFGRGRGGDRFR